MAIFEHVLWGYRLTFPEDWVHQTIQDTEGFAAIAEALQPDYDGPHLGHVLVRAEWNGARQELESLWSRHIGLVAGMLGAKKVGAAPWRMGGASGYETEILLPKQAGKRLWAGILSHQFSVLHFMVMHRLEERAWFEPLATQLIASLRFPQRINDLDVDEVGLPLPPGYKPVEPGSLIHDIADPACWRTYDGESAIGALQAFYVREAPAHDWVVEEFMPFPGPADFGFARFRLRQGDQQATLGLLPYGPEDEALTSNSPARLAFRLG